MSTTPRFAMPVGLPANPALAASHFAQLRTRFDAEIGAANSVSAWVANEALYSGVYAMTRGLLAFIPAGGTDFLGRTVAEPSIVMRIWANEYLALQRLAGRSAPKFIWYRKLDTAEVQRSLQAIIAAQPRLAPQASTVLTRVMTGQSKLLVNAGALIGRGLVDSSTTDPVRSTRIRVDIEFQNDIGDPLDVAEALDLWRMTGEPLVMGHPLLDELALCNPSVAPVEGRTCISISLVQPLPNGPFQLLVDGTIVAEQFISSDRRTVYFRALPHSAGYVDLILIDALGVQANYSRAFRYVEEFDTAFHAIGASFGVALNCVEDVVAGGSVSDRERVQLDELADLQGRTWRELVAIRADATSHAPWDPEIQRFATLVASQHADQSDRVSRLLRSVVPATPTAGMPVRRFEGVSFFSDIRPLMDSNRGLFLGLDTDRFVYVCVDATFYRFAVLDRSTSQSMSEAMLDLMSRDARVRAVANGQYFGRGHLDYIYHHPSPINPGRTFPLGQYIDNWVLKEEAAWLKSCTFGQTRERGQHAWVTARVPPGSVATPLRNAVPAEALVQAGIASVRGGVNEQLAPRMVYGVHRASNTAFFLATEMVKLSSLASHLEAMGVDDAMALDGGTSVLMAVDGVIRKDETKYMPPKDWSIPVGGCLLLDSFAIDGEGMIDGRSTDPSWPSTLAIHGITGTVRAASAGGIEFLVTSFGSAVVGGVVREIAPGATATLVSTSTLLTSPRLFRDPSGTSPATALLSHDPSGGGDGVFVGEISIPGSLGILIVNVRLQADAGP